MAGPPRFPKGRSSGNYEQLIRDIDVVREWTPDIVVLDEAQRIKNWATKTALTVKRLDPPYRLVLTGTPMENRLDELASIVEWVDDLALEPKWRLAAWHTTPVDETTELRELISQLALSEGRKVVVFSQWRRMLRLAHWATRGQLAREGVRPAFFTGEEGQNRRTQNLVDFHDDPACRVLFAADAGGVGLNLQRAASACINIEQPEAGGRRQGLSGTGRGRQGSIG